MFSFFYFKSYTRETKIDKIHRVNSLRIQNLDKPRHSAKNNEFINH